MVHTHFIGIGGTGLSAIAKVLLERGEKVSGSDLVRSPLAEAVEAAGARVFTGHHPENVAGADVVVRSSAVRDTNVEVVAALQAGVPVVRREEYLKEFLAGQFVIGVAGTHGKTTTTSMIVWMLHELGLNPGFIVGGEISNLGTNAAAGGGELFVIEADEYDHMFWGLTPTIAVVTNIEHDHPDCFPTERDFMAAFEGFVDRIRPDGSLVVCVDDPGATHLLAYAGSKGQHWLAYSLAGPDADYTAANLRVQPGSGYSFEARRGSQVISNVYLDVPGRHNVLNALAALVTADLLNLDLAKAGRALSTFRGASRRFERLGEAGGVIVVDDYGHHPTEIRATLEAARSSYPAARIWAVWQPHTYSRTISWLEDFGAAFTQADQIVVTGVYAAREKKLAGFDLAEVAGAIRDTRARVIEDLQLVTDFLLRELQPGDLVIIFSAGDATRVSEEVFNRLKHQEMQG
ncbi:MAG: UDP-N-acetylmuramate--L-alanine ligase [Anaerolineales bacterium]|nr:UDP-N-acetylmuramate--L-alanine ligase [Anaerolineales bacterium]